MIKIFLPHRTLLFWLALASCVLFCAGCSPAADAGLSVGDEDMDPGVESEHDAGDGGDADQTEDGEVVVEEENPEGQEASGDSEEKSATIDHILPIQAIRACTPAANPCVSVERVSGVYASYRKDYFYPTDLYPEPTEEPLDGGRFQIVASASTSGAVVSLSINGHTVEELLTLKKMEWYHYWPRVVTVGAPVWVAFHSRSPEWDLAAKGRLQIETDAGTAVDAEFPVSRTPVPVTYVTTDEARTRLFVHLKNTDSAPHTATRLIVNGIDVLKAETACLPSDTIKAGESVMWTIPLCGTTELGDPWSVVIEFADSVPSVGAGRIIRPFFPIEVWPPSGDCIFPGINDPAHQMALAGGVDTFYSYWNSDTTCGYNREQMFGQTLPARGDTYLLLGDDFPFDDPPENALPNREMILGFLTGDESDWHIYDENGYPNAARKAAKTRSIWKWHPDLFTYNGAMTNKRIGSFAGMADVQGIDLYNAACAPYIFDYGNHPSLRAPYDYLRNARNNHMPLPTWLYSQGLGGWATQPAPQEILVQAFSVAAAGGKGLMWFMFNPTLAGVNPDVWAAISKANWIFRGVRKYLREGDVTGMARSDDAAIVELIRSRDAIVAPIISLAADKAPTDLECLQFMIDEELGAPHWMLSERAISVTLTIPDDFTVIDAFEISDGRPQDISYPASLSGRDLMFHSIPMSNRQPVRMLILASDPKVRLEVAHAMTYP